MMPTPAPSWFKSAYRCAYRNAYAMPAVGTTRRHIGLPRRPQNRWVPPSPPPRFPAATGDGVGGYIDDLTHDAVRLAADGRLSLLRLTAKER